MDCEQDIDLIMGISTNNNVYRPDVISEVTGKSDVKMSYDELYFNIKRKLEYTRAVMTCDGSILNRDYSLVIDRSIWKNDYKWWDRSKLRNEEHHDDDDDEDDVNTFREKKQMKNMKFKRLDEQFAITKLKAIRILHYDPPHLKLQVESNARLKPKCFVSHFKKVLGIDCSITACDRTKFGPVTVKDCLRKHEMYYNEMKEKSDLWLSQVMDYIHPLIQKSVIKQNKYLRH